MELHITDNEAALIATKLANLSGHSINEVVRDALRKEAKNIRLDFDQEKYYDAPPKPKKSLSERLMEIGARCAKLPVLDGRSPEEILGYDEHGLPH